MRVVILGKGLMLANIIVGVLDAGADIVGVFRYEQTSTSRLKLFFQDFFKPASDVTLINKYKLNQICFKSANSKEFRDMLVAMNVDLIIVGTWKEKISKETFNIPTIATVNVHPSMLPKYRGPNPYMQTILHGEKYSGVTLHLMNEKFDEGAILKQEKIRILDTDTSKELRERTVITARKLVYDLIKDLNDTIITPITQNERYATYFQNISGEERMLDFKIQTSVEISRTIRALHPFLPCYIVHEAKFFVVNPYKFQVLLDPVEAKPGTIIAKNHDTKSLTIVCADGKAISFNDLALYKASLLTKKYIKYFVKL